MKKRSFIALALVIILLCFSVGYSETTEGWYTDPDNGTTFRIPKGWKESAMSSTREYLQVKFVSDNTGAIILYGSADGWLGMSNAERAVYQALGQTADNFEFELTADDVKDMYGLSEDDIQIVTYGCQTYYRANTQIELDVYNQSQNVHMTQLITTKGRWLYFFQYMAFQGKPDEMSAFEELMDTVKLAGTIAANQKVEESLSTANEAFFDLISGLSFTVPVGWDTHTIEQDISWLKVELYQSETGPRLGYSCEDLWEEAEPSEIADLTAAGFSRADVDNDFMGIAYQAEYYEVDEKDISIVTIAGQEYFVLTVPLSYQIYGVEVTMDALVFECYRNGYCHTFSLGGMKTTDADHKILMELLNTVKYSQTEGRQ